MPSASEDDFVIDQIIFKIRRVWGVGAGGVLPVELEPRPAGVSYAGTRSVGRDQGVGLQHILAGRVDERAGIPFPGPVSFSAIAEFATDLTEPRPANGTRYIHLACVRITVMRLEVLVDGLGLNRG